MKTYSEYSSRSLRAIGRAEIKAAQKQVAVRRTRRLRRNIILAVGLVVLYMAVTWMVSR